MYFENHLTYHLYFSYYTQNIINIIPTYIIKYIYVLYSYSEDMLFSDFLKMTTHIKNYKNVKVHCWHLS